MKKIRYEWNQLNNDCIDLAKKLKRGKISIKNIYGVPRGGLVPAVIISHLMGLPLIVDLKEISDQTLVVDDISDSGETLLKLQNELFENPSIITLKTATLWIDKNTKYKPMLHCRVKTGNQWIVFPFETFKSSKKDN